MTVSEVVNEINIECVNLCFMSDTVKDVFIASQTFYAQQGETPMLFQLVQASLTITNGSKIHSQDRLVNSFQSTLIFEDSFLYDMAISDTSIQTTQSTLEFNRMTVYNITNSNKKQFILANLDSDFRINDVQYSDSSSILFSLRSSEMSANNLTFTNIVDTHYLFSLFSVSSAQISNFGATNSTSQLQNLIDVRYSAGINFSNFTLADVNSTVIAVSDSNITEMSGIDIQNSHKAFRIVKSKVSLIKDSVFIHNGAENSITGGAFQIYNSDVSIQNTSFNDNMADTGAGIHFNCNSMTLCNLSIDNSTFDSNSAETKGGAIYYGYNRPMLADMLFSNNSATYGPDLASYAVKIRIQGSDTETIVLDNIGSGIVNEEPFTLELLDFDNQVMILNNENQITISAMNRSQASVSGANSRQLDSGVATFDSFIAIGDPGSKGVKFQASSKSISNAKVTQVHGTAFDNLIDINFRMCKPGEYTSSSKECVECSAGTYSLIWEADTCLSCIDDVVCLGKDELYLNEGFWRMTANSTKIIE